jgi:hypothetical protein
MVGGEVAVDYELCRLRKEKMRVGVHQSRKKGEGRHSP